MAKQKTITKKPTAWKETESPEFSGVVTFPETFKEALEMGYKEEFIMAGFESFQTIRAQSVINSYVGDPADYEDGVYPTNDDVQKALDEFDFTQVNRRATSLSDKVAKIAEGAKLTDLQAMISALEARIAESGESVVEEEV